MPLGLALWLACLATALSAQSSRFVHEDRGGDGAVTVVITMSGGASHTFGLGFARCELENTGTQAQSVRVVIRQPNYSGCDVSSRRSVVVEPGKARFFLPVGIPPEQCRLEVTVAGETQVQRDTYRRGAGLVALFISDRSGRKSFGTRVLDLVPSMFAGISPEQAEMQSQDLPHDWRMLTAFSLVIIDGDGVSSGMSSELQEALRRYAHAGGSVVVSSPQSMPTGSLRELGEQALRGALSHGLGHIVALPAFGSGSDELASRLAQLPMHGVGLWPATDAMFPMQEIAGLGKAPVTVFVMIILAFAILVGPVNFLWLRRRKQPLLALVTVPVLGFGTTILILGYGILHDGFGVRGVAHSCTLLDQRSHEAVSVNASTLFAGMAPSDMTMPPDTLLLSARAGVRDNSMLDRWSWDADTQRLDGGILPSRTPTPLLSVQQGPVRERLTVRRSGDSLEALLDGGLQPQGRMVLRDLDGQYWAGDSGRLLRVSEAAGRSEFAAMQDRASTVRVNEAQMSATERLPLGLPQWGEPGSYATQVERAPWLHNHGVEVAFDQVHHFVFGRMHAQDFVQ